MIDTLSAQRARLVADAAAAKKAFDIAILDVGPIISIADLFVLVSASNARQVRTIVDEVGAALREREDSRPIGVEGLQDATWVLLDYGDVVVHVFLASTREYYDLDRLWADAPRLEWHEPPVVASEQR